MAKIAYHSPELYPELEGITSQFEVIRAEALLTRSSMMNVADGRVEPGAWRALPLLPEEEDREVIPEDVWRANRRLAPMTTTILSAVSELKAYAFSALEPGGHIRPHKHTNPYVTAALCLQNGGGSYIMVGGERRDYHDGEVIVFDYTLEHEVVNNGVQERIVLLMLLDNRME